MKKSYLGVGLLIVFTLLAINYERLTKLDEQGHALFFGNAFLEGFSWFGNTSTVVAIAVVMIIWQLIVRNWRGAVLVFVSVAGATLINQVLKRVFERPRPEMIDQLESFSFPSGHSMMSVGYLFVLAYLIAQLVVNRSIQRVVYGWTFLLVVCIGLSRIARGHHYVTDVFAGWSLASAWVIGCIMLYERALKRAK